MSARPSIALRQILLARLGGARLSRSRTTALTLAPPRRTRSPWRALAIVRCRAGARSKESSRAARTDARYWAMGAARDSAVGAVRRHLGISLDARADHCFDPGASTKAASTPCALVAICRTGAALRLETCVRCRAGTHGDRGAWLHVSGSGSVASWRRRSYECCWFLGAEVSGDFRPDRLNAPPGSCDGYRRIGLFYDPARLRCNAVIRSQLSTGSYTRGDPDGPAA